MSNLVPRAFTREKALGTRLRSCPREVFLDERKSLFQRRSVFRDVSMQANLGLMFERKAKISCNGGRSVTKNLRVRQDCMRTSRKTDFRQKNETSAGLKITFVDMTYPNQRPELPSLSHHFLLLRFSRRRRLDDVFTCLLVSTKTRSSGIINLQRPRF